ncbi:AIM14 [Candida oxycetoniae]|uniref:AIM14 n=1 Tax=Candida oxycetoniae TaxID=497107 RepID=A0AAI9SYD5_9ASCO|nr:AIM14 [Candida oxycetoniae]KAI3405246.2 AIM14 [Candida oxycetoniae]
MVEIEPRHGDHHYINVKYGYIIFGLSLLQILYLIVFKLLFIRQWKKSGIYNNALSKLSSPATWPIIAIWVVTIAVIAQYHIGSFAHDYIVVAKRLGRIAYSLIPMNIYLILRFPNSFNWNSGYYLQNLNQHKWLSRVIFILSLLHAVGFTYKWIKEGTISKFVKFFNFLGVLTLLPFMLLIIVSIRYMRRKWYFGFYIIHNITSWLMVILITFHARPGVLLFGISSLILLALQLYLRFANGYRVNATKVIDVPSSSLQIVEIPTPQNFPLWLPASHLRINYPLSNARSWIGATHPYTIASIHEDGNNSLTLITKKTTFQFMQHLGYLITGPYPALPPPFYTSAQVVNIVCGGSGISFGLPIFQFFKSSNHEATIVNLVWCVRNKADLFIVRKFDLTGAQIYVTSPVSQEQEEEQANIPEFVIHDEHHEENHGLLEENIELQSIKGQDDDDEFDKQKPDFLNNNNNNNNNNFKFGRPKLDEVFAIDNPTITYDPKCSWVLACGPDGLIKDAKIWAKEHDYEFFYEKYEM